jgi:hypothetical protein
VVLGDVVYLPWGGTGLHILDFTGAAGDSWTPKRREMGMGAVSKNSKGVWVDKWSCGSPLVLDGIVYNIDVYATLYAIDLNTGKNLYREELCHDFNCLMHYCAVGVSASLTLGGRHIFAMDNQGNTVVFEPGPVFKKVAVNRIERQIDRPWPVRPQEETGYSPPLFEGSRMYLRGEYNLYCIAKPGG